MPGSQDKGQISDGFLTDIQQVQHISCTYHLPHLLQAALHLYETDQTFGAHDVIVGGNMYTVHREYMTVNVLVRK